MMSSAWLSSYCVLSVRVLSVCCLSRGFLSGCNLFVCFFLDVFSLPACSACFFLAAGSFVLTECSFRLVPCLSFLAVLFFPAMFWQLHSGCLLLGCLWLFLMCPETVFWLLRFSWPYSFWLCSSCSVLSGCILAVLSFLAVIWLFCSVCLCSGCSVQTSCVLHGRILAAEFYIFV
jgi:hypothetical protein